MAEKKDFLEEKESEIFTIKCDYLPWQELSGATILVTGATGLVGSTLIRVLLQANEKKSLGLKLYALVRDIQKAESMLPSADCLHYIRGEVDPLPKIGEDIDYIVHTASPTASKFFVEHPVETIKAAVCGTMNILELAKEKQVRSFVYLSSMEAYGEIHDEDSLREDACSRVRSASVRSCYPQSKLLCENLCVSYHSEYGVPAKAIRLAQTFGPGVPAGDNRVFAQFARAAIKKEDIVLMTDGSTKQCYLYTLDAASAILAVLLKGESGQIFNAANPATYCSIREMGELVASKIADGEISVIINAGGADAVGKYPPTHKWNLNVDKLLATGWYPTADLEYMYRQLICDMI